MLKNAKTEITTLIRAKYPLIWCCSYDEDRVVGELAAIAKSLDMQCKVWTLTNGLSNVDGTGQEPLPDPSAVLQNIAQQTQSRCLYVLKDFHPFVDGSMAQNVPVIRLVKDVARTLQSSPRSNARCIVFLSGAVKLPAELQNEVALIDYPLPTEEEIKSIVQDTIDAQRDEIKASIMQSFNMEEVVQAAKGLTQAEVNNCLTKSLVAERALNPKLIMDQKKQIVRRDGLLELIEPEGGLESVGGLDMLKGWLVQRRKAMGQAARAFGLPEPKGVVLAGVPGTGKSLAAKACSIAWGLPIIKLDFGKLFGGLLGETESNMRRALAIAEAIAPCILMVDEMDKGLGGSEGSNASTDGGAQLRMVGSFLTWLQEKKSGVFVVATLNKVDGLPPELFRKGRLTKAA
jgi:hypothetical protein